MASAPIHGSTRVHLRPKVPMSTSVPDLDTAPRCDQRPPLTLTHGFGSRRVVVPLLAASIALVGALWAMEWQLAMGRLSAFDAAVLRSVAEQRSPTALTAARVITHLGDLWVVAGLGTTLVLVARWRAGRWDAAKLVAVVVGGALVITAVSKTLTGRPRPDEALTATVSLAFPSGHASRAAAVYMLLAWLAIRWAKYPATRYVVPVLAVGMALATGWSRVLLGVHWPTDILAGFALGAIWLTIVLGVTRPAPARSQ
jgi:membrane-associated phospholipid phosphatase